MACVGCGKEAQFVLEDGEEYCCDCLIKLGEDKKKELEELGGVDELDVIDVMMKDQVNRLEAIRRLKEKQGSKR